MRKACKNCRAFVTGDICKNCNSTDFSDNSKGRITILDPENSEIAKKLNITKKGEYAIRT